MKTTPPQRPLIAHRGLVLPTLLMLTLILLGLVSVLLATGTTSLRTSNRLVEAEHAYRAAEAGLVQATAEFINNAHLADDEIPTEFFSGKMRYTGATYRVELHQAGATLPGGLTVPEGTMMLISHGEVPGRVSRRVGALVRIGGLNFRAGVLARTVAANNAVFSAYDSNVDVDPAATESTTDAQAILTSNGNPSLVQFQLENSEVRGSIYTSFATSNPDGAVERVDSTVQGTISSLAEPIEIEEFEVPRVERGQGDPGEDGGDDVLEPGTYPLNNSAGQLNVTWDGEHWVFKHRGKTARFTADGVLQSSSLDEDEKIVFAGDGIQFTNRGKTVSVPLPGPVAPSTTNPAELKSGAYSAVTVDGSSEATKFEDGGVFVVRDLRVFDGGQLKLDSDTPVAIYVTGSLTIDGADAVVNTTQKPPNLKIYYTGTEDVLLAGGADAYFTVIAPNADVRLSGPAPEVEPLPVPPPGNGGDEGGGGGEESPPSGEPSDEPSDEPADPAPPAVPAPTTTFYGALVGRSITVENANFYFDIATEGVGVGADSTPFELLARYRF